MVSYVLADSVYMRVYLGASCVPRVPRGVRCAVRAEGKVAAVLFKGLKNTDALRSDAHGGGESTTTRTT